MNTSLNADAVQVDSSGRLAVRFKGRDGHLMELTFDARMLRRRPEEDSPEKSKGIGRTGRDGASSIHRSSEAHNTYSMARGRSHRASQRRVKVGVPGSDAGSSEVTVTDIPNYY